MQFPDRGLLMATPSADDQRQRAAGYKLQAAKTITELNGRAAILTRETQRFAMSEAATIDLFEECLALADQVASEPNQALLASGSVALEAKMQAAVTAFVELKTSATALVAACGVGDPKAEWEECRRTIDRFDKLLVDIRKTAFGVITTLFSAFAFLFALTTTATKVPPGTKVAVFAVICLLIVSGYGVDRVHQIWLEVAVARAKDLEERLGFALTTNISKRFSAVLAGGIWVVLYGLLLATGWIIFFISLEEKFSAGRQITMFVLLVLSIIAIVIVTFFDRLRDWYMARGTAGRRAIVWGIAGFVVVIIGTAFWCELRRRKII
jgi:hypothetical protein